MADKEPRITVQGAAGGRVENSNVAGINYGGMGNKNSEKSFRNYGNMGHAVTGNPSGSVSGNVGAGQAGDIRKNKRTNRNEEDCYVMNSEPRGLCYIFSNKNFEGKQSKRRVGNEQDRDALDKVFKKLKFEVKIFEDSKAEDMREELKTLSEEDHTPHSCVVVIFLTHGEEERVQGTDNRWLKIDEITSFFTSENCKSLAGKPKLFFFQSCRGHVEQKAVKVQVDGGDDGEADVGADGGTETVTTTLFAPKVDFLFGYAAIPGTKALRNPETGSWYIHALAKTLDESADSEDLLGMMTKVKKLVNERKAECTDGSFITQTAETNSRLLKKLYF